MASRTSSKPLPVGGLYCPWTWGMCVPENRMTESMTLDRLDGAPTPWHALVDVISLAYSFYSHSRHDDGRRMLVRAYMYLLPHGVFPPAAYPTVYEYREGLRHILDSSWALASEEYDYKRPSPLLRSFVESITPFTSLDAKQRAALIAIQARVNTIPGSNFPESGGFSLGNQGGGESLLRTCIDLSPMEGEWRFRLAEYMDGNIFCSAEPSEKLQLLRDAYRLRKTPDCTLLLARTLLSNTKHVSSALEARSLLDEALSLWPDNPYVLVEGADIIMLLDAGKSIKACTEALRMTERAVQLVGDRAYLRLKLAHICSQLGRSREAGAHLAMARRINPTGAPLFMEY
ncbi:uncharacterized protein LOC113212765 isoform X1 [Frankliniella occidentalis]|uniref:Uncharacterized protein LOC113212765 isoform X1 n=1 Tax=Frankliniella occidentalis TaxID=133901 RepID=A0A9C6TXZ1_FRAOC|nr:uncharacterized protein LOC113212765 isoform X1 [Frankliniella occidentalis]